MKRLRFRRQATNPLLLALVMAGNIACQSSPKSMETGLQGEIANTLPARMVVLPCSLWPANLSAQPSTSSSEGTIKSESELLCQAFDQFVLRGFENQPFMRGYSPKTTSKLLQQEQKPNLLTSWKTILENTSPSLCPHCKNIADRYKNDVSTNTEWLLWLSELSQATRHSDAVLFPFIEYLYEEKNSDRGLHIALKKAALHLILIDNNSGQVIWRGFRNSLVLNRRLDNKEWMISSKETSQLKVPSLDTLRDRILTDDIWKDFPGRQNYK